MRLDAQLIIAFSSGFLFSYYSRGLAQFLVFSLVYEALWVVIVLGVDHEWSVHHRFLLFIFSFLGWILGSLHFFGRIGVEQENGRKLEEDLRQKLRQIIRQIKDAIPRAKEATS